MSRQRQKPKIKKCLHRALINLFVGLGAGMAFFFMFSQPPNINITYHWRSRMLLMLHELMPPIGWLFLYVLFFMGLWLYDEIVHWHFRDFLDEPSKKLDSTE